MKSKSSMDLTSLTTTDTTTSATATTTDTTTDTTTAKALQVSDFFYSRGTNIIQPLLRYCKYELEQEGTFSNEEIAQICHVPVYYDNDNDDDDEDDESNEFIQKKQSMNNNVITSITFRGQTISMNESNIKMAFIKINTVKEELDNLTKSLSSSSSSTTTKSTKKKKGSSKDSKLMQLLNCYDDAVTIVTKNLEEYQGMSSGPSIDRKRMECLLLLGYFKYMKIQMLMKRNESMVDELRAKDCEMKLFKSDGGSSSSSTGSSGKQKDADARYKQVEEIAHLYDALLQDAKSVVLLPGGSGVINDEDGDNEGDIEDEFILEANANVLRIRALRCYYIGRMYAADTVAKYKEALALFDQSLQLASEAAEEIAACQDMDDADEFIESMALLQQEIAVVVIRTKASAFLASRGSEASSVSTGLTLLRRLDDFDSGGKTYRIADVPPALEPIPCKPAFFDIANNFVREFPLEELEYHAQSLKASSESRGFMNWFRRS